MTVRVKDCCWKPRLAKHSTCSQPWKRRLSAVGGSAPWPGPPVVGRICAVRKTDEAIEVGMPRSAKVRPDPAVRALRHRFHNLPSGGIPSGRCAGVVVFKRFKSLAQLGHLPKHDDASAQAWLYGKLLVALLVEKVVRLRGPFPPGDTRDPTGLPARGVTSNSH